MGPSRRRPRRHLTDEELEALRHLLSGRRPSQTGAIAALIAAAAALLSAVTTTVLALWDAIAGKG